MSQLSNTLPSPVKYVRLIFFLVIIAYFMDIIDASIVTVALPSIRVEFGASIADSQWIYGSYAITLAGVLLLMGRAGDIYGQKKIFVSGLVIFTIASFTIVFAVSLAVGWHVRARPQWWHSWCWDCAIAVRGDVGWGAVLAACRTLVSRC